MLQRLRNYFISGLIVFLPLALTMMLVTWGVTSLDKWLGNVLQPIVLDKYGFYFEGMYRFAFHFLCLVLLVYIIILIGMLARNFIGKKIYDIFE
ncbi:MAG: hypothetical protein K8I00_02885, partial [Candidatus Omnitrophica bacterium]|nr:hypothetical protein [Candidatus Omnitrophota bacterium]